MALKRRMQDFQRCLKNVQSFSDNLATVLEFDTESLEWITIQIRPIDSLYHGGQFDFKIVYENTDPLEAPRIDCLTKIYHPNIDLKSKGNVCLSLFDEWDEHFGLEDIIQGLLFLLYNPNIEDPLPSYFRSDMDDGEMMEIIQNCLHSEFAEHIKGTPLENVHKRYDNKSLAEGIELILEKASQMLLVEEEEEEEDKDEETNNGAVIISTISRQDSKVDKTDGVDVINTSITRSERRRWHSYIPQTFTPPQPDFLVNVVLAWVNVMYS